MALSIAVSYTHLDVYKRQRYQLNIHLDPQLMGQFSVNTKKDVYKRQELCEELISIKDLMPNKGTFYFYVLAIQNLSS